MIQLIQQYSPLIVSYRQISAIRAKVNRRDDRQRGSRRGPVGEYAERGQMNQPQRIRCTSRTDREELRVVVELHHVDAGCNLAEGFDGGGRGIEGFLFVEERGIIDVDDTRNGSDRWIDG